MRHRQTDRKGEKSSKFWRAESFTAAFLHATIEQAQKENKFQTGSGKGGGMGRWLHIVTTWAQKAFNALVHYQREKEGDVTSVCLKEKKRSLHKVEENK